MGVTARYGGPGGRSFNDTVYIGTRILEMEIKAGQYLDGFRVRYQQPNGTREWGEWHGGYGGTFYRLVFRNDEYITAVRIGYGALIDRITIYTNINPSGYGPYGGYNNVGDESFNLRVNGFHGRGGTYVDALGFFFEP